MESFSCKTRIVSGEGSLSYLQQLGAKRFLLVTDPFFVKNGMAQQVLRLSGAEETAVFDRVTPDPSVTLAAEGTELVRKFCPDTIAALGGGSTMDCAKAMAFFATEPVHLVAIPTTAGSGSEVTDFAVLTHGNTKHPLVDPRLCPEVAILDSSLVAKLPKKLVADGGFDVLTHALEALVSKNAGCISDALAKDAFRIAFGLLPAGYVGHQQARERIQQAATMAGMAFSQAGLGLCHALSHSLGGAFHIPHGRLNGILLPAVVRCNAHMCAGKYAALARSVGLAGSADTVAVRNLSNALTRLRRDLEMPQTLKEAGIEPGKVRFMAKELTETTLADPCCKTNPLPVEDYMVRRILEEVAGND